MSLTALKKKKKEVQQAFFDAGIGWEFNGKEYQHLNAVQYTNTNGVGFVTEFCMHGSTTEECNLSPAEFLELVYEPEQQGHPHAELMALYAEDAKTHPEPWKLWQVQSTVGWHDLNRDHPKWRCDLKYRRKPKTKLIHGVEVPDISFTPNDGEEYVYPDIYVENYASANRFYSGYAASEMALKAGCCYPYTEDGTQAAILHAKAWLGLHPDQLGKSNDPNS